MAQSGAFTSRIREDRSDVWDESRDFGFEWRSQGRREPRRTAQDTRSEGGHELRPASRPRAATAPARPASRPVPRVEPPPAAAPRRRPAAAEPAFTLHATDASEHREPAERRTIVIRGRGDDRLYGTRSRRRPTRPRHERAGFRADRTAMWAVLLGIAMLLVAAMSAHGAVIVGH